jgi:hypothetical protein
MKKNTLLILLLITISSCKKNDVSNLENPVQSNDSISEKKAPQINSCDDAIYQIIKSSNLKKPSDFKTSIDEIVNDSITIKVYIENNVSDNQKEKNRVESVVAWVLFLPHEKKLLNITSDPDFPKALNFEYPQSYSELFKLCGIQENKVLGNTSSKRNCKTVQTEYEEKELCVFLDETLKSVYQITLTDFEDAQYLKTQYPTKSEVVDFNKNGLINVEYIISKSVAEIICTYEGGTTSITIKENGGEIEREIQYSAD